MKLRTKRTHPPYYGATLGAIFILYCWTIGNYVNDASKSWVHSKPLALAISSVLFLGGLELCYLVFDRLYPRIHLKKSADGSVKPPLLVRVVAFFIDLVIALVAALVISSLVVGQKTSNGFTLTGWRGAVPLILIVLYFFVMNKYLGGTLAKRMLRIN